MTIVYFTIIIFFIILLLVFTYICFSKVQQAIDKRRIRQLKDKMAPVFDKHMELNSVEDIPKQELDFMREKVLTKIGLQAFNSLYFTRIEQEGVNEKLINYVNCVIDYRIIHKNRVVRDVYWKSYILYLCAEYYMNSEEVIHYALESLDDKSLYVRHNALRLLRHTRNIDAFIEGWQKISQGELYYNNKFIVDEIDSFEGDTEKLNEAFASKLAEFSPRIQKVIIDHFSNQKVSKFANEVLDLIRNTNDKEVRIAGIKYFGFIYHSDAYKFIVEMFESDSYEIRAVCARAIALYPCEETIILLKKYITDYNWFVRYNCAFTLIHLESDVFKKDSAVGEVIRGKDRFAREIMIFTLYEKGFITHENEQERLACFQLENKEKRDTINELRTNHPVY